MIAIVPAIEVEKDPPSDRRDEAENRASVRLKSNCRAALPALAHLGFFEYFPLRIEILENGAKIQTAVRRRPDRLDVGHCVSGKCARPSGEPRRRFFAVAGQTAETGFPLQEIVRQKTLLRKWRKSRLNL